MIEKNKKNFENIFADFEGKLEKFQESGVKVQNQNSENWKKLRKSVNANTSEIQKSQANIRNFEEEMKNLKLLIENLSIPRPVTPISNPSPTVPTPEVIFPTEELNSLIETSKQELIKLLLDEQEKVRNDLNEQINSLESSNKQFKTVTDQSIQEIKDKLAWLPIKLSQLDGMSAAEARLFTVEARLRSEENSRIQSYNYLLSLIDPHTTASNPHIPSGTSDNQGSSSIEKINYIKNTEKKTTPGGMCTTEWWKQGAESEKKKFCESESIRGIKLKFSTPVPEIEHNSMFLKYKEKKIKKQNPKSMNSDFIKMPKIHSALGTKYTKSNDL